MTGPVDAHVAAGFPVVGVIGGGQLARMMQAPAIALGVGLRVLATTIEEAAKGIRVLKAFGRSPESFAGYRDRCQRVYDTQLRRIRLHTKFVWVLGTIPNLTITGVLLGGVLALGGGKMRDYKVPVAADKCAVPVIAFSTTAGTWSECTRFTVINEHERDDKMMINGLGCLPLGANVE